MIDPEDKPFLRMMGICVGMMVIMSMGLVYVAFFGMAATAGCSDEVGNLIGIGAAALFFLAYWRYTRMMRD